MALFIINVFIYHCRFFFRINAKSVRTISPHGVQNPVLMRENTSTVLMRLVKVREELVVSAVLDTIDSMLQHYYYSIFLNKPHHLLKQDVGVAAHF